MIRTGTFLLLLASGAISSANGQSIQIDKDNRTIAITTSDNARAIADIARVHIGYTAYANDAQRAYAEASELSNAIIGALKKAGAPDSAIQSETQNITEQQNQPERWSAAEREQRKYTVTQSWTVTASASAAGDTLNIAVNAGANSSGNIEWSVKDEDDLQAKASANALARARKIAEQMAKGLNAQIGALMYASNEAPPPPNFALPSGRFGGGVGYGVGGGRYDLKMIPPLVIIPQEITKSATVYAVFALQ